MYWRVRKVNPDQLLKKVGLPAALIVSVFLNIILLTKGNPTSAVTQAKRADLGVFAKQVTMHIFDANYPTFQESMTALLTSELGPTAKKKLIQSEVVPKDLDTMKVIARDMAEKKSVSCVRFDSFKLSEPDKNGFINADMQIAVVIHDAEGVRVDPFQLKYQLGEAVNEKTQESKPILVDLDVVMEKQAAQ